MSPGAQEFSDITSSDPELSAHGGFYACSLILDMEDRQAVIEMQKGTVEKIDLDPSRSPPPGK